MAVAIMPFLASALRVDAALAVLVRFFGVEEARARDVEVDFEPAAFALDVPAAFEPPFLLAADLLAVERLEVALDEAFDLEAVDPDRAAEVLVFEELARDVDFFDEVEDPDFDPEDLVVAIFKFPRMSD